jgi:hypothetical protein
MHKKSTGAKKSFINDIQFKMSHAIFKHKVKLDNGILGTVRGQWLRIQILNHMRNIRTQDRALLKYPHQLEQMPENHLVDIARQRGCDLDEADSIKEYMRKFWLPLSAELAVSDDLLIWISLCRYSFANVIVE